MQILPSVDDFAHGTPAYGSLFTLYLGAKLAHTTAVSGLWLANTQTFVTRALHGGYQASNFATGVHDYNAAFHNGGSTAVRTVSGALFRRPFSAAVTVTGIFEMRAFSGSPGILAMTPRGVIARAQDGTLSGDGTANVELRDGTCYLAALYQKSSDSTLRCGIIRVNNGLFTLVIESGPISTGGLTFTKLATVSLTVSGITPVTLSATASGLGIGTFATLNTTDASASRIIGGGRCGLIMGSDRNPTGPIVVDLCHVLQVIDGGVVLLRDEFRRLSLAAAKKTTTADLNAVVGSYVSSAWYWDAATYDGTDVEGPNTFQGSKRIRRNATAGRIDFDHQITDDDVNAGRLLLSQRPAGNLFSQHRSMRFIIPTAPTAATGEVWVGIALRASQAKPRDQIGGTLEQAIGVNPNCPGATAYVLALRAKTSTQVIWQLQRIIGNTHIGIARFFDNSPFTLFPGYGVQFALDFDVYPRNAIDPTGTVEIVCKVDGNLIPMPIAVSPGGLITNPSTGKYLDATGTRIQQGFGEGIFLANGLTRTGATANDIDPVLELWDEGVLTNAAVLDADQPSVVLLPEAAATGTPLDQILIPDTPLPIDFRSWHVSHPMESGHRSTGPRFRKQADGTLFRRKLVRVSKHGAREAELLNLLFHFDAHKGVELGFNATLPGYATERFHYASDRIRYRMLAPDAFEMDFDLEALV